MYTLSKASRMVPILSIFALLLCLAALAAQAQDFTYTTNNGTITITGYTGPGGDVTIPSIINNLPVTTIGDEAFYNRSWVTSVTIPGSVATIGDAAFMYCNRLADIVIGTGVTYIGKQAFFGCSLTSVTIPDSVTTIGNNAFYGCLLLTNVMIGNGVTAIGDDAFRYCSGLLGVAIGTNVSTIGNGAFFSCGSLTSVTIPNSVTSVGDEAFGECTSLNSVAVGNGVASIWERTFLWCRSLTSVNFRGNAPTLAESVFRDATNATVYYLPGTTGWGPTFGDRPTALWHLPSPVILTLAPHFGVQTNQFAFRISWATDASVVVEASSNLATPAWFPVTTNNLIDGWTDFSDPEWTEHPTRFYRIRSP